MGSLLPGWDEHKDMERSDSLKSEGGTVPEWLRTIRENGSPVHAHTSRSRDPSSARGSPGTQSPVGLSPRMVHDKRMQLKRSSLPMHLINANSQQQPHDNAGLLSSKIQWWSMIDSSSYNAPGAEQPESGDYKKGSYMPQHDVATAHKQEGAAEPTVQPAAEPAAQPAAAPTVQPAE